MLNGLKYEMQLSVVVKCHVKLFTEKTHPDPGEVGHGGVDPGGVGPGGVDPGVMDPRLVDQKLSQTRALNLDGPCTLCTFKDPSPVETCNE